MIPKKRTAVVHDGSDVGGFELQRARWEIKNSNGNLVCGLRYLIDTSNSALTLTMPYESQGIVPHIGDMLEIVDFKATWGINNASLEVATGSNQMFLNKFGNTDNCFTLDVTGLYVQFIWDGTYWRILA